MTPAYVALFGRGGLLVTGSPVRDRVRQLCRERDVTYRLVVAVAVHLVAHAGDDGRAWPSSGRLAAAADTQRSKVTQALRVLVDAGVIERAEYEDRCRVYVIRCADDMAPPVGSRAVVHGPDDVAPTVGSGGQDDMARDVTRDVTRDMARDMATPVGSRMEGKGTTPPAADHGHPHGANVLRALHRRGGWVADHGDDLAALAASLDPDPWRGYLRLARELDHGAGWPDGVRDPVAFLRSRVTRDRGGG